MYNITISAKDNFIVENFNGTYLAIQFIKSLLKHEHYWAITYCGISIYFIILNKCFRYIYLYM